jgi:hypothetical protein
MQQFPARRWIEPGIWRRFLILGRLDVQSPVKKVSERA